MWNTLMLLTPKANCSIQFHIYTYTITHNIHTYIRKYVPFCFPLSFPKMVAREFHLHQEVAEDPFEAEETLSLSDLPNSAQWDNSYSKEGDDVVQGDDDFFEFISEDFTASTRSTVETDIIFCGKIINAYRESPDDAKQSNSQNLKEDDSCVLLPRSPNKSASKSAMPRDSTINKGKESKDARNLRFAYSVRKVSLMRSPTKSRWYLFMFGMPSMKLPAEMELSDIRSRHIRRRGPATAMFPAPAGGEVAVGKSRGRRSLWVKMLRSLGFGCSNSSKQVNDVVKSFKSMNSPRVKTGTCWHVPRASQC